jgi:class 3 adenylate cyclase
MKRDRGSEPDRAMRRWLASHGLEQYADAFERDDIDLDLLPELTDSDLEKLGLTLGHRKKLLRAAARLPVSHASSPKSNPPSPDGRPHAERRQLTVLFCDLADSTQLTQKFDPEVYRELVRAYQAACMSAVTPYEGYIAQYLGDGVLIYFGYPRAHEDDAQRAILAGMAIVEAVSRLELVSWPLAARVGIDTGVVVVGEMGSGASQEQLALGDTPNVAARLQNYARPNTVVLSDRTRQVASGAFEYLDLGSRLLKGISAPVRAWQAVRPSHAESRFEAASGASPTPMVGPGLELAALLHAWERARSGNGQLVMLSGEAGIGKSRILRALRERLPEAGIRL